MLIRALDTLLDRTVLPGYSRLGYVVRSTSWSGDQADPQPGVLAGRTALVTGGSAGLGLATAEGLARLGAAVQLVVRDVARGDQAAAGIAAAVPGSTVRVTRCDISDLDDVRRAAPVLAALRPSVVIHNAGVLPERRTVTAHGHELALATHVLGPFLLTALLVPALQTTAGRVILVASGGMYAQRLELDDMQSEDGPWGGTAAYARTKRMQVVLSGEWARRLAATQVTAHAVHPGWADTPGLMSSLPWFRSVLGPALRTPAQGADTTVWLAATPTRITGTGGFWHDRRRRPEHYVPWTRESAADRDQLWRRCEQLSGHHVQI